MKYYTFKDGRPIWVRCDRNDKWYWTAPLKKPWSRASSSDVICMKGLICEGELVERSEKQAFIELL